MKPDRLTLSLLGIVIAMAVAGYFDAQDAEADYTHYCAMVKARAWPDYRGTYQPGCEQPKPERR